MRGTFNIYKNGQLVNSGKNLITSRGRIIVLNYLAGLVPDWAGAIGLGVSSTAATVSDVSLGFELGKAEVNLKSVDVNTGQVTVKGEIPSELAGKIYELAAFPAMTNPMAGGYVTRMLGTFEPSKELWSAGISNTVNYRVGQESLELTAATSTSTTSTNNIYSTDLTGYSNVDNFALAYTINDARTSNIKFRFKTDASNYFEYSFAPGTVSGYFIKNFNKSNLVSVGSPAWNTLTTLEVVITATSGGSTTVQFDGISVIDMDYYDLYAPVSRAVLTVPQTKVVGEELEVEYVVEFDV